MSANIQKEKFTVQVFLGFFQGCFLSLEVETHFNKPKKQPCNMNKKTLKLFLRLAIVVGFLSAVADRFGLWSEEISAWGNWDNFLSYTQLINPWVPSSLIPAVAIVATLAEFIFAIFLLIGFKTELFAKLSGYLLLLFALSMTFSTGIKSAFDYSVFIAAAGAFSLAHLKEKYLELDCLFSKPKTE